MKNQFLTYLVVVIPGLIVSLLLTPFIRNTLLRRGIVDPPEGRKVHTKATPRLGGIAIYAGFWASVLVTYLVFPDIFADKGSQNRNTQVFGLFIASTFVVIVGIYDDLKSVRAYFKLIVEFVAACILISFGFNVEVISNPFGANIELGILSYPFTILWVSTVIVSINFIDGLDGLASGVGLMILMTFFLIGLHNDKIFICILSLALAGSILGFLRHNFFPATIFMGDSGSMFIGLVIATLGLISSQKTTVSFAIVSPLIALGYPVLDTALTLIRRTRAKNLFGSERGHIHHVLLSQGYSHPKTVVFLYVICLFFATMAFLFAVFNESGAFTVGVLIFVAVFVFMFVKIIFSFKRKAKRLEQERDALLEAQHKTDGQ